MFGTQPVFTLKEARSLRGLSRSEVANALNISIEAYSEHERYQRVFRTDKAWKFSQLVRLPMELIIFLPSEYERIVDDDSSG